MNYIMFQIKHEVKMVKEDLTKVNYEVINFTTNYLKVIFKS